MIRLRTFALTLLLVFALPVSAQEDDDDSGGLLTNFLQDTLSSDSRFIKVTGLEGAFSSQATIKKLTVADNEGIWLTVLDAELDWNRLALLRGHFSVNALTAKKIIIARRPGATDSETDLPNPEVAPFELPELPVEIELAKIQIDRIELGKDLVGVAAVLDVTGALKLAEGSLDTRLAINRLDRDGDAAGIIAKFDNKTRHLALNLSLTETANGLISNTLHIPDRPSMQLSIKGEGPISAFTADVTLASDATPRLSGHITLQAVALPGSDDTAPKATSFSTDLSGDLRALLTAQYHPFFGAETELHLVGQLEPDGRLEIEQFRIKSESLALTGKLAVDATGQAENLALSGSISPPIGAEVVLPLTGPPTAIRGASILVMYDASVSNRWRLNLSLAGLSRPNMSLQRAEIQSNGTVLKSDFHKIKGAVTAELIGLVLSDPDMQKAIGSNITLGGDFLLDGETELKLNNFVLQGDNYSASVEGTVDGLNSGFALDGLARIRAADLARFAGLAGRPIAGAVTAQIKGSGSVLGGKFDIKFDALAQDLETGIADIDPLIVGRSTVALNAARDETGLVIRYFGLNSTALTATVDATAKGDIASLNFRAGLDDLGRLVKQAPGPISLQGKVDRKGPLWSGNVQIDGAKKSTATLSGTYHTDGSADFTYDAVITQIERFVSDFSGNLTSTGKASRSNGVWHIDSDSAGPAGIVVQVSGSFDESDQQVDLNSTGKLQLGIVNRMIAPASINGVATFNLAMKGAPALKALTGNLQISDSSIAIPQIANTITGLGGSFTLNSGSAQVAMNGSLRTGGGFTVDGPVNLAAPYDGTLTVRLNEIILTDNVSYESSANGQLVYAGPLTGNGKLFGHIDFGKTEINIAAASGAASAAPIPDMAHVREPSAVYQTLSRAGLVKTKKESNGPVIGLDIALNANNRIFVRGRGLQAELGGEIHIRGTTESVEPAGQIKLIRGNLDIFGKRLNLTKGLVTLQGQLVPYIEFAASTTTTDGSATLEIEGPLTSPEITVTSDPDRPPEEALAMLIFGNQFSELSPLKIAQMAASLAQLRGGKASGKIRDTLGVDTVDMTQDEDGNAQIGAGAYVADNVYTDISVNTNGETELNINLDVTNNLTVKGTVDSTGSSALGLFFERDY
ncbi:MAG: translocation/assembly module TamB domain-containing protein [Rhodobacteraceae bacterium]|nr:translocation/assembly module TamB domain-containing protein [Paracoccaceae bacterium]